MSSPGGRRWRRPASSFPFGASIAALNTDEAPTLSERFGIRGIPTLALIGGGREIGRVTGALPWDALSAWIQRHLPVEKCATA